MLLKGTMGFFGNVWVVQNILEKIGDHNDNGHKHEFDHLTLLTHGSVRVEVEGHPSKDFVSPTYIVIRKNLNHKFIALEDNSAWYCIHVLRDLDGNPIDDFYSEDNDPLTTVMSSNEIKDKQEHLFNKTIISKGI